MKCGTSARGSVGAQEYRRTHLEIVAFGHRLCRDPDTIDIFDNGARF